MAYISWQTPELTQTGSVTTRETLQEVTFRSLADAVSRVTGNGVGFGLGVLSGTVTVRGVVQAGAIVLLFDEETNAYVNSTTTNASGVYTFNGLPDRQFFMVIKEPTGLWEYRVSSRRTPVV